MSSDKILRLQCKFCGQKKVVGGKLAARILTTLFHVHGKQKVRALCIECAERTEHYVMSRSDEDKKEFIFR